MPRPSGPTKLPKELATRLTGLLAAGQRRILGLAGPPGAGKSSLAQALLEALPGRAMVVPMDGFHLAGAELARLGRAGRKGAEDTFDALGYVALLERLRAPRPGRTVYAPRFERAIEEAIAGAIAIAPEVPLVITEGNYLLLERGAWAGVHPLLDQTWFVEIDDAPRRARLLARHMAFGRTAEAARDWVAHTDDPNAALVNTTRGRADLALQWPPARIDGED
jgi:pantothenate kinase